jgi:uncharacterized membrane-anchored protein YhcB (DUF1043 family)
MSESMNECREDMRKHFAAVESLINEIEKTCQRVHHYGSRGCSLGTDCPFHAAFEVNTQFGCRLIALRHVMKKRERRHDPA